MRARIPHQTWIILAAATVFFTNLGGPRLWDDDEPRNATCAREMFQSGDWIVPTFDHALRTDKPVLVYWLMMGSYALFGVTEFAARFPSALLGVGAALMTYHLGRLLFRPQAGLWAGLIMATNLMFGISARAATPDSTLIFCTTLALLIYVWSVSEGREGSFAITIRRTGCGLDNTTGVHALACGGTLKRELQQSSPGASFRSALPRTWRGFAGMYAAMGAAVLAKGPIGVLLPCASIGLFLLLACVPTKTVFRAPEQATLWRVALRRLRFIAARLREYASWFPAALMAMRPLLLAAVVLAVALPWYLAVAIKTGGAWTEGFFVRHNFERFMQPLEGHRGTIFFHLVILIGCFFPWSFLLPAGAVQLVRRVRTAAPQSAAYLLVASWIAVWFGVFSLSGTKLPSYVLPAYPLLAVVCGVWVADWIASPGRRATYRGLTIGWAVMALTGAGLTVGVGIFLARRLPDVPNFAWIGLIPLVGAGVGWLFHRRREPARSFAVLAITAVALGVALFAVAEVPFSRRQNGAQFAEILQQLDGQPDRVGMFHISTAGVVFYGNDLHDFKEDRAGVQSMFATAGRTLLVTDADGYNALRPLLPPDVKIVGRQPNFFRHGEMIVIGREPTADVAANRQDARRSGAPLEEARRVDERTPEGSRRR